MQVRMPFAKLPKSLVHFVITCIRRQLPFVVLFWPRDNDLTQVAMGHPLTLSWHGVGGGMRSRARNDCHYVVPF